MNNYIPDFFIRLGVDLSATEKDVKRAYAKRLKSIDQSAQADEFLQLRQDYEWALAYAKNNIQSVELNQQDTENNSNNNNETISSDPSSPANSQSINPTIDHEDEADNVDKPEQNTDFNFNSELNLNKQTNVEIDIQNEFEDQINNKRKFYQKPDNLEIPFDLMLAFVQEVKNSYANQASLNDHLVLVLLKKYLAKDEFVNLEITEHFEKFLAEKLLSLEFGIFNLPILKILASHFNWYDESNQVGKGKALAHVSYIAGQIDKSSPIFLQALHRILQTPNLEQSTEVLDFYQKLYIHNDDIINFCVPLEHIQKWKDAKKSQFFIFNWWETFQLHFNKLNTRFKGLLFAVVSLVTVLFLAYVLTGLKRGPSNQDQHASETRNKCDAIYANAIDKNWQGLSLFQTNQIYECSVYFAPQICETRDGLSNVLSAARALYPIAEPVNKTSVMRNFKDVYINSNGLHYEINPKADCEQVKRFVTEMRWDQSSDEKALAKMIPIFQACFKQYNPNHSDNTSPQINSSTPKQVFNDLASSVINNYFNYSVYSINASSGKTNQLSAKQMLLNKEPYQVLSQYELNSGLLREKGIDVLNRSPNAFSEKMARSLVPWPTCISLESAKNLDINNFKNMGPLERLSTLKMLESK